MNKITNIKVTDKIINQSRRAFLTGKATAAATHLTDDYTGPQIADINSRCLAIDSIACQICGDICEPQAISFHWTTKKVSMPMIDTENCTGCGECLSICPPQAISLIPTHKKLEVIADA